MGSKGTNFLNFPSYCTLYGININCTTCRPLGNDAGQPGAFYWSIKLLKSSPSQSNETNSTCVSDTWLVGVWNGPPRNSMPCIASYFDRWAFLIGHQGRNTLWRHTGSITCRELLTTAWTRGNLPLLNIVAYKTFIARHTSRFYWVLEDIRLILLR